MEEDAINFAEQYLNLQEEYKQKYSVEFKSPDLEILGPDYKEAIISAEQMREFLSKRRKIKN